MKIAKWKDINFYAMKQAADKSHRALHKFIRRYEVLRSLISLLQIFPTACMVGNIMRRF